MTELPQSNAETETKILDLAERLIRQNGYNGFSFREIASGVGVKSSSVHYYFPTKADLGAKVARRYADRFLEALGDPEDSPTRAQDLLTRLHDEFAKALGQDGQMCLCGVLAAEATGLPASVAEEAKGFFDRAENWLRISLSQTDWGEGRPAKEIERQSLAVLAQLEGGLLIARVQERPELFDLMKPQIPET
ncbi:TetR/AcrR family transcriptional regulator [Roseibium sp. SCPC15]|uniref:TetR/AcrR family transcriptional regulator n=1 Tax=Roseibium sp. SCP15 TaxID=3141376 RepID=UPI00333E1104